MSYDCEIPEFYSEDFPKAGKVHRCCECRAPIEKGEKHLYARMKFDGEFSVERQHMACRELCMYMNTETDWECCPFGGMLEAFGEGEFREDVEACHMLAEILIRVPGDSATREER